MKRIIITATLFLCMNTLFAQTNFSGAYTIDTAKISFGAAPHWVLPASLKVSQQGTKITESRSSLDAQGNQNSFTENLAMGDTTTTNISGNLLRKATISWDENQTGFTISYATRNADGTPSNKVTEKWSLEDGGKTLVLDRYVEQANGLKYPIKGYYTRSE